MKKSTTLRDIQLKAAVSAAYIEIKARYESKIRYRKDIDL